ncbi:hypothetical protein [Raoultella ornithinolytica]|uniref:hypothetical protein n=1 Tax=Raoultella ornithinolytica TaxID=54291 RepID=UPI001F3430C9|nr:hypothetical protein [Raoultella ornithinolytica]MCF6710828.1 hypothetical protein [Raoultella ornithinolytica]HCU0890022.1 hypothetical protein [Raoultella ornithinolytica]HDT6087972.1 hypothetical protein [Raoultella ornithinolytica]
MNTSHSLSGKRYNENIKKMVTIAVIRMLIFSFEKNRKLISKLINLSSIYSPKFCYELLPDEAEEDVQAPIAPRTPTNAAPGPRKAEATAPAALKKQLLSTLSYKAPDATSNSLSVNCLIVSPFLTYILYVKVITLSWGFNKISIYT